jgi:ADP-ribosylglycohydrolase
MRAGKGTDEREVEMGLRNLGRSPWYGITELDYGILGLAVGDALGVPGEFCKREYLKRHPITGMQSGGKHQRSAGTWSDDTALALALAHSLAECGSVDYYDIQERSFAWLRDGCYTPDGIPWGVGDCCLKALSFFRSGVEPLECGGRDERSNGNGSLMRILPLVFFLHKNGITVLSEEGVSLIHNVSALTHAHPRSKLACVIYCRCAELLIDAYEAWRSGLDYWSQDEAESFLAKPPRDEMQPAILDVLDWHSSIPGFASETALFEELTDTGFADTPEEEVDSSGYVVSTLKAVLWCLWNYTGYRDTVLAAVNLGSDADTTAAVVGGLAGLWYREGTSLGIPKEWRKQLRGKELIDRICRDLSYRLGYNHDIIVEEPGEDEWRDTEMEDIADRFRGCMTGIAAADGSGSVTRLILLVAAGMAEAKERMECRGIGSYIASGTGQVIDGWLEWLDGGDPSGLPSFTGGGIAEMLRSDSWFTERSKTAYARAAVDSGGFVAGLAPIGLFLFDHPKYAFTVGAEAGENITDDESQIALSGYFAAVVAHLVNDDGDIEHCIELALSDHQGDCVMLASEALNELLRNPLLQAGLNGARHGVSGIEDGALDYRLLTIIDGVAEAFFDDKNCYYMTDMYERIRSPQHRVHRDSEE